MSYVTSTRFYQYVNNFGGFLVDHEKKLEENRRTINLHSEQLVDMGKKQTQIGQDMTKMGQDLTWFGEKVTKIDATDTKQWKNIEFNIDRLNKLQDQINQGKQERDAIQLKFNNVSYVGHGHDFPTSGGCAWYDVPCKMKETTSQIGLAAILAGAGFVGYQIFIKKKKRK